MKLRLAYLFIALLTRICQKACVADQAKLETVYKECQHEHGVSEVQFADVGRDPSQVDMNLKCFHHCLVKNMGFLDAGGKFDDEKLLASEIMPNAQSGVISDCKAMHDMTEDPCEYIYDLFDCIRT